MSEAACAAAKILICEGEAAAMAGSNECWREQCDRALRRLRKENIGNTDDPDTLKPYFRNYEAEDYRGAFNCLKEIAGV